MEQNGNNRVLLTGYMQGELEYSHSLFGESFYAYKLAVPRLSGAIDTLPITISERLIADDGVADGACMSIIGQLRSYNKLIDGNNRLILTVFTQHLNIGEAPVQNEINICGYVCKTPVYRTTPFQREIADVLLAVNRAYNKSDYIPCITWGRNARYAQTLCVGSKVAASGRIQSREYQKTLENGEVITRTAFEVSVATLEAVQA